MNHTTPIPVALCCKDPQLAQSVCEKLLPDLDVIHVCLDLPTALAELPQLFSPMPTNTSTGETTNPTATPLARSSPPSPPLPASGVGSNSTHLRPSSATPRPAKRPQAVLFSHKFTRDEAHAVTDAVLAATAAPSYTTHLPSPSPPASPSSHHYHPHHHPLFPSPFPSSHTVAITAGPPGGVLFVRASRRDVFVAGGFVGRWSVGQAGAVERVFRRNVGEGLGGGEWDGGWGG